MAHMEDVLDLYAEPYDPKRRVVCFDETSTQLLAETRAPMPPRPGRPHCLLKEFYSSTSSRYPAGHAQEPSRPNAPGRNFPSRNPSVNLITGIPSLIAVWAPLIPESAPAGFP